MLSLPSLAVPCSWEDIQRRIDRQVVGKGRRAREGGGSCGTKGMVGGNLDEPN